MWALRVWWVLLGTLGVGSAQLTFQKIESVSVSACNGTEIVIPCIATNLERKNTADMFVKWKLEGEDFFSFDGFEHKFLRNSTFQSTNLLNLESLTSGIASIKLSRSEAIPGNYTCVVVEFHREGKTVIELLYGSQTWFEPVEKFFIIATVITAAVLFLLQFGFVAIKFDMMLHKMIGFGVAGLIVTIVAVVGGILLVQEGYKPSNQAGLGLVVLPVVLLVPPLYFLFGSVFEKPPLFAIILVALKALGYLIAVAGFAVCVSACPPKRASVMIAGVGLIDVIAAIALVYMIVIGTSFKDHQPPRKAVEEPLNARDAS
ncbi:leukocyte surface antigen CD47 isoform X2 [Rhineura floridana]|uniref:leukocyte surface antigen CD47 isoform X2 n=1 Tax=Rhineura floridana TaxID=261503 RepID=UPI002AC7E744|nr:leukocyte surface antigen CD47 isoform X2 [Rhineura floridana]